MQKTKSYFFQPDLSLTVSDPMLAPLTQIWPLLSLDGVVVGTFGIILRFAHMLSQFKGFLQILIGLN